MTATRRPLICLTQRSAIGRQPTPADVGGFVTMQHLRHVPARVNACDARAQLERASRTRTFTYRRSCCCCSQARYISQSWNSRNESPVLRWRSIFVNVHQGFWDLNAPANARCSRPTTISPRRAPFRIPGTSAFLVSAIIRQHRAQDRGAVYLVRSSWADSSTFEFAAACYYDDVFRYRYLSVARRPPTSCATFVRTARTETHAEYQELLSEKGPIIDAGLTHSAVATPGFLRVSCGVEAGVTERRC